MKVANLRKLGLPAIALSAVVGGMAWLPQLAASDPAAEVRRFGDLSPSDFEAFLAGESDLVVEFRAEDRIALEVNALGDFLVSETSEPVRLKVASTFFLKLENDALLVSEDGVTFKPLRESVRGHLSANAVAGDDGRVDRIRLELDARRP